MSIETLENGIKEDDSLYDPQILQELDWESSKCKFRPVISPSNPGENLTVRPLRLSDYHKGFTKLLSELTKIGDVSKEQFTTTFLQMKSLPGTYYVTVIEDLSTGQIIGAATLLIERKFIHGCAMKGHLEDIVVNDAYRGKQLGKLLVETITRMGKVLGVYKISLNCKDNLIKFYEGFGYVAENGNSTMLVQRFRD